jgi:hypothetical protein
MTAAIGRYTSHIRLRELPIKDTNYTLSQPLPALDGGHPGFSFLGKPTILAPPYTVALPPQYIPADANVHPGEWVYTNGSEIKERDHLGATVVHIPTRITLYIYAVAARKPKQLCRRIW